MKISEITNLITTEQIAELKALKRAKFLKDKANEIVQKTGGIDNMTDVQQRNYDLFVDIANEIEMLNESKKALYSVLEHRLFKLLEAQKAVES